MFNYLLLIASVVPIILVLKFLFNRFYVVPQNHKAIIERFQTHTRVIGQGIHFLYPFESIRTLYWTYIEENINGKEYETTKTVQSLNTVSDQVYDCPRFKITTSDFIEVEVNPVLFFKYVDIVSVMYTNEDLFRSLQLFVHTELNKINQMTYTELNEKLNDFENKTTETLKSVTKENGIEIKSFKIQSLRLPQEIEKAKKKEALIKSESLLKISENDIKLKQNKIQIEHELEIEKLKRKHQLEEEIIQREHQMLLENRKLEEERKRRKLEAELEIEIENKKSEEKRKREELEFTSKLNFLKKESELKVLEIENLMKLGLDKSYFVNQLQNESLKNLSNSQNSKWIIPSDLKLIPNNLFNEK
jgi:regulator of protease activity HflC (stomatin/prohibitin superfamily)